MRGVGRGALRRGRLRVRPACQAEHKRASSLRRHGNASATAFTSALRDPRRSCDMSYVSNFTGGRAVATAPES